jgi:hypothetical protein
MMQSIKFTWDVQKNRLNQKKHGVSFEEAESVFYDETARLTYDPDHSIEEERYVILGMSNKFRMLLVCHCYREQEKIIRIILARKAAKNEQRQYTGYFT